MGEIQEKVCREYVDKICVKVPADDCKTSQVEICEDFVDRKCDKVPVEDCQVVQEDVCVDFVDQVCFKEPVENCQAVQENVCVEFMNTVCESVPIEECKTVQEEVCKEVTENECKKVPVQDCKMITDEICNEDPDGSRYGEDPILGQPAKTCKMYKGNSVQQRKRKNARMFRRTCAIWKTVKFVVQIMFKIASRNRNKYAKLKNEKSVRPL